MEWARDGGANTGRELKASKLRSSRQKWVWRHELVVMLHRHVRLRSSVQMLCGACGTGSYARESKRKTTRRNNRPHDTRNGNQASSDDGETSEAQRRQIQSRGHEKGEESICQSHSRSNSNSRKYPRDGVRLFRGTRRGPRTAEAE